METRSSGAEGGSGKRAGSNPGTAPRSDPYVVGKDGKTAVGTLVERVSRFVVLVPLAGRDAATVSEAVIDQVRGLPDVVRRSLMR